MPLSKLVFKPGINRDQTNYASEGGWYECDKVRFRSGFPEKIGGWVKYSPASIVGICRSLFNWVATDGNNLLSIASNKKVYVEAGGNIFDITPVRLVVDIPAGSSINNVAGFSLTASVGSVTVTT